MGIVRNSSKAPLCVGRYKPLWFSFKVEEELEVWYVIMNPSRTPDQGRDMVRTGNCIAARSALLILLALSIGVHYIVARLGFANLQG